MAKEELTAKQMYAHNALLDAQIAELETERQKYVDAKDMANGFGGTIDSSDGGLINGAADINQLLKQIKINGEPVGKGVFGSSIKKRLSSYNEAFTKVASQCDTKIEEIDNEIASIRAQYLYPNTFIE